MPENTPKEGAQVQAPVQVDEESVKQQAADVFGVLATTLNALTTTVSRVEGKVDRQGERMGNLVDTTNHRLDDFREDLEMHRRDSAAAMLAFQATVTAAVAAKADKKDLTTGMLWAEVKSNRVVQTLLLLPVVAMAPVVFDHWHLLYERASSIF